MSFSRGDYEHAIARIFFVSNAGEKHVVGTGFLAAPGYVLTCAHVVLEAKGIKDNWENYLKPPEGTITLNFFSDRRNITAEVIAWEPYDIEVGDIAALKLHASPPERAKPMPLEDYSCEDIRSQPHYVYGFTNAGGNPTEAYRPRGIAPIDRCQFHKEDDPHGDTIAAGFSGAPVWNLERSCAVGMVATAWTPNTNSDARCRAFVIREASLSSILDSLVIRSLDDLIERSLAEARGPVRNAVDRAFALCEEGRVERDTRLGRLQYLTELSNRDWQEDGAEVDRLTQFAVFLAVMDGLPESLRSGLKAWVRFRGGNYERLYVRANEERQARDVSSAYAPEHLIVQIKPDEQGELTNVKVSVWAVGGYDPVSEPRPLGLQDRVVTFSDLPDFVADETKKSELKQPVLHFFVGHDLLSQGIDRWKITDEDDWDNDADLTLGNRYRLVMRTDLSQVPGRRYRPEFEKSWEDFIKLQGQSPAQEVFVRLDCSKKNIFYHQLKSAREQLEASGMVILENITEKLLGRIFEALANEFDLLGAFWSRQDAQCRDLAPLLDCALTELPERIFQERVETLICQEKTHVGYHLSLVWEDYQVIPPTWKQFDPEEL